MLYPASLRCDRLAPTEFEKCRDLIWQWVKKGHPKNPIGERKNRPKPVVPNGFPFDPQPFGFGFGFFRFDSLLESNPRQVPGPGQWHACDEPISGKRAFIVAPISEKEIGSSDPSWSLPKVVKAWKHEKPPEKGVVD